MLRGHGTVKSLLGRSVVAQKPSGASSDRRDPAGRNPSKRSRAIDVAKEPEDDGLVRCPVCAEVLHADTANAHVGTCPGWHRACSTEQLSDAKLATAPPCCAARMACLQTDGCFTPCGTLTQQVFPAESCLAKKEQQVAKSQTTLFSWKKAPGKAAKIQEERKPAIEEPAWQHDAPKPVMSTRPAPIWTFTSKGKKAKGKKRDELQVKTYIVARRFYDFAPLSIDAQLSFAKHVDDRGYRCFAAFYRSGMCAAKHCLEESTCATGPVAT